jgi:pentatricopeptide repeat protein
MPTSGMHACSPGINPASCMNGNGRITFARYVILGDARCDALSKADKYLCTYESMSFNGSERFLDVVTYTSYMRGLAIRGDLDGCFNTISRMQSQRILPSTVGLCNLRGLPGGDKPHLALTYLQVTIDTLVSACINSRQFNIAEDIILAFHEHYLVENSTAIPIGVQVGNCHRNYDNL